MNVLQQSQCRGRAGLVNIEILGGLRVAPDQGAAAAWCTALGKSPERRRASKDYRSASYGTGFFDEISAFHDFLLLVRSSKITT